MKKVLMMAAVIFYFTTDGQTKKIAEKVADEWVGDVVVEDISQLPSYVAEDKVDRVVIGASIRYGHYHKSVVKLIVEHVDWLEAKHAALFSVNLTARKPEKRDPAKSKYINKFLEVTGWVPNQIAMFAGQLNYPKYSFLDRQMIRLIMKMTGGCSDGTSVIEYTDWADVRRFARTVSNLSFGSV